MVVTCTHPRVLWCFWGVQLVKIRSATHSQDSLGLQASVTWGIKPLGGPGSGWGVRVHKKCVFGTYKLNGWLWKHVESEGNVARVCWSGLHPSLWQIHWMWKAGSGEWSQKWCERLLSIFGQTGNNTSIVFSTLLSHPCHPPLLEHQSNGCKKLQHTPATFPLLSTCFQSQPFNL